MDIRSKRVRHHGKNGGKSYNRNGSGVFYVINIIVSTAVVETRTYVPRRPYSTAVDP